MNNFATRAITGTLFVLIVVAAVVVNAITLGTFFALVVALSSYEFTHLLSQRYKNIPVIFSTVISTLSFIIIALFVTKPFFHYSLWLFIILLIVLIFIIELYRKKENPIENIMVGLFPLFYIVLPFSLLYISAFFGTSDYHYEIILGFFLMLWASDTGAYLVGSKIGKHKLFERISPKKTWEGSIGGAVLAIIVAALLNMYYPILSLPEWIIAALIIVIFGNLGDLTESLFKRSLSVKDSGNILPGHGGLLDRFDGLLIAAPVYFIYLMYIYRF